jgi:hypothetical protein
MIAELPLSLYSLSPCLSQGITTPWLHRNTLDADIGSVNSLAFSRATYMTGLGPVAGAVARDATARAAKTKEAVLLAVVRDARAQSCDDKWTVCHENFSGRLVARKRGRTATKPIEHTAARNRRGCGGAWSWCACGFIGLAAGPVRGLSFVRHVQDSSSSV